MVNILHRLDQAGLRRLRTGTEPVDAPRVYLLRRLVLQRSLRRSLSNFLGCLWLRVDTTILVYLPPEAGVLLHLGSSGGSLDLFGRSLTGSRPLACLRLWLTGTFFYCYRRPSLKL